MLRPICIGVIRIKCSGSASLTCVIYMATGWLERVQVDVPYPSQVNVTVKNPFAVCPVRVTALANAFRISHVGDDFRLRLGQMFIR